MKRWALILGMIAINVAEGRGQIPGTELGPGGALMRRLENEQKTDNETLWAAQSDPAKKANGEFEKIKEEHKKKSHERALKAFEIEAKNRGEELGARAMELILREAPIEDQKRALRILRTDYALGEHAQRYVGTAGVIEAEEAELFLRRVAEENEDPGIRGTSAYCLGRNFELLAEKTELAEEAKLLIEDAKEMYRRGITEYEKAGRSEERMAMQTVGALFRLEHLQIGQTVPEIEGVDIEGKSLRLSDFRGKVVALVFWATWCGPCMQMVPHERELVKRMKGRPFALVGVNGDSDREKVLNTMAEEEMTWPSFYEGLGGEGKIPLKWNVEGWPTTYVMDAAGVIRFKNVRGETMDEAVEQLLAEIEEPAAKLN